MNGISPYHNLTEFLVDFLNLFRVKIVNVKPLILLTQKGTESEIRRIGGAWGYLRKILLRFTEQYQYQYKEQPLLS